MLIHYVNSNGLKSDTIISNSIVQIINFLKKKYNNNYIFILLYSTLSLVVVHNV